MQRARELQQPPRYPVMKLPGGRTGGGCEVGVDQQQGEGGEEKKVVVVVVVGCFVCKTLMKLIRCFFTSFTIGVSTQLLSKANTFAFEYALGACSNNEQA
ncbi:hypothetical protein M0804_007961 [Polistes exclamans]|nr:hypothetical protein M0804_007961 [Polistes exclamans]